MVAYGALDLLSTFKADVEKGSRSAMTWLFPAFHISYGVGTARGVCKALIRRRNG